MVGVKVAQHYRKIKKIEAKLRTPTNICFAKYFVRTGNPRHLGTKQKKKNIHKSDQKLEVNVVQR